MKNTLAIMFAFLVATASAVDVVVDIYAPTNSGTAGQVLISKGAGKSPEWGEGGIGNTTVLELNGGPEEIVGSMVIPQGYGESNQVLKSNGPLHQPSWGNIVCPNEYGESGQILKSNGGTTPPSWVEDNKVSFDEIYPVGSIYLNVGETLPATFKGTWVKITDGQFLMSANGTTAAGTTGGMNSMTLSADNLPSHTHSVSGTTGSESSHTHGVGSYNVFGNTYLQSGWYGDAFERITSSGSTSYTWGTEQPNILKLNAYSGHGFSGSSAAGSAHSHSYSTTSGSTGASQEFDNRPSFIAVSMWQRTN